MAKAEYDLGDDRFIRGIIRRKAKQLVGRACFTKQDCKDLEQDLFARVQHSLESFDPDRGHLYSFITAVVQRHVANILRNRRTEKRGHRRTCSLNVTIRLPDEGLFELAQTISDHELDNRLGCRRRSDEELTQLAIDLADLIPATLIIAPLARLSGIVGSMTSLAVQPMWVRWPWYS